MAGVKPRVKGPAGFANLSAGRTLAEMAEEWRDATSEETFALWRIEPARS